MTKLLSVSGLSRPELVTKTLEIFPQYYVGGLGTTADYSIFTQLSPGTSKIGEDAFNRIYRDDFRSIMKEEGDTIINGKPLREYSFQEIQDLRDGGGLNNSITEDQILKEAAKYRDEIKKNSDGPEAIEESDETENINTPSNTNLPAQLTCYQPGTYGGNYTGTGAPLPAGDRLAGGFSLQDVKNHSTAGGNKTPRSGWGPWERTLQYVVNPVISAGYAHSGIKINSGHRYGAKRANHRTLGAIDFGHRSNSAELLANFAWGMINLNVPFDRLLLEKNSGNKYWIHVQVAANLNSPLGIIRTCLDPNCNSTNRDFGGGIDVTFLKTGKPGSGAQAGV